jgi:Amt family ammonium transporter
MNPGADAAVCLGFVLLTPLAATGVSLINAGLGRSRNAAHAMVASLLAAAVAAVAYALVGFCWQGLPGLPGRVVRMGGGTWDWLGAGGVLLSGVDWMNPAALAVALGMISAGITAMIPVGSGADRWRLGACCASAAMVAGFVFPVFSHWAWGVGWLAQPGKMAGAGRGFLDAGGAGAVQVNGGLTALAVTWILGPRRGKYTAGGMPSALPGHNAVIVLLGCFLGWVGWIGLGGAGAMLWLGEGAGRAALIAVNTTLGAASAALAAAGITRARFGKTDASLSANGWVGGLVASSAGCSMMRPAGALLAGMVAGALVVYSVEWLEMHLGIDDPAGAISVHGLAGIWGLLAAGFLTPGGAEGQWIAQLAGVAALLGFVLPVSYGFNFVLNRFYRLRVAAEGERQGLDLFELGAGAYPDFASHNEDFWQR